MFKCFYCGAELCWDSSCNLEDAGGIEGDFGCIDYYHCINCGRSYEISDPPQEERDSTYQNYWK